MLWGKYYAGEKTGMLIWVSPSSLSVHQPQFSCQFFCLLPNNLDYQLPLITASTNNSLVYRSASTSFVQMPVSPEDLQICRTPFSPLFFLVSWFTHHKFKGGYSWFVTFLLRRRAIFISEGRRHTSDHLVSWRAVFSNSSGPYVVRGTWIKFHCCMPVVDCLLFFVVCYFSPFRVTRHL